MSRAAASGRVVAGKNKKIRANLTLIAKLQENDSKKSNNFDKIEKRDSLKQLHGKVLTEKRNENLCSRLDKQERKDTKKAFYLCFVGIIIVLMGCVFTFVYFKYRPFCCDTIADFTSNYPSNCEKQCTDVQLSTDRKNMNILVSDVFLLVGPVTLGVGFLVLVCGVVWVPIIKEKYKKLKPKNKKTSEKNTVVYITNNNSEEEND